MQLQWSQTRCTYLQRDLWEVQNLEQTQDVRLTDDMPDIGRVLCAWGQPVLRSKEWRKDAVSVTGGVMAWALYIPEDGSAPRCVEAWLPFQTKWNLPDSRREGTVRIRCCLRSVDARTLSSRKVMLRASVGLLAEVLEPAEVMLSQPEQVPEGVQVLEKNYPAVLPKEAGEKQFQVDTELTMPAMEQVLCYLAEPEVTEQNVIGSRGVFRGNCQVKLVYLTQSGQIATEYIQIPFAQFVDLDTEYDKDATVSVMMALSAVEWKKTESGMNIQCGLIVQYVVHSRQLLQLTEDAYGLFQEVKPTVETLQLPMVLDESEQTVDLEAQMTSEVGEIVDVTFLPDHPVSFREEQGITNQMNGCFQIVFYDQDGLLQSSIEEAMTQWDLPMSPNATAFMDIKAIQPGTTMRGGNGIQVTGSAQIHTLCQSEKGIPMITQLQLGELVEPTQNRPSLILQKPGESTLWELAKACGSTVESITKANQLTGEPESEQMLLIPVL